MSRAMVVTPVLVNPQDEFPPVLFDRICEVASIENVSVLLVAQGGRVNFGALPNVRVLHVEKPLGIWGAIHRVYPLVEAAIMGGEIDAVVHNATPLYFGAQAVKRVLAALYPFEHVVGVRMHIASSLSSDPRIGRARALMECFLTVLAGILASKRPDFSEDGFSGLQGFSAERYMAWQWDWLEHTTWGGELEGQVQSVYFGCALDFREIPDGVARTWPSTLGIDFRAVVSMIDQARNLPALQNPPREAVWCALEDMGTVFIRQPWMNAATAPDEVRALISAYNLTARGPYLTYLTR